VLFGSPHRWPLARSAWTDIDWITLAPALSNEKLRAVIERPVFIVAPPRSGGTALYRSLARAPGIFSSNGAILDGIFELEPQNREWDSNRLTGADVEPRSVEELRGRLSQLTSEDRCHLNGLCVIDDEPRYVTALGETDTPGGWRETRRAGES
jgi:hypothetical protein